MNASKISLVSVVAVGIVIAAANTAMAGFGGGGGGNKGGGNKGGMKMNFVGNNNKHNDHHDMHHNDHHDTHHYDHHYPSWYYSHKFYYDRYYSYPYVTYYSQPVVVAAPVITAAPSADISVAAEEPTRTQVPMGSVLMINGQALGSPTGTARLVFDNRTVSVPVLQWSTTTAKIQLPKLNLSGPLQADLEVLRADGSLASKSAIEMIPTAAGQAVGQ